MKLEKLPGAWVLESFQRGNVDINKLTKELPDDVNNMLYNMDTISPDSTSRLLRYCAEISDNPDFGLMMNERVDITMYGLFGYLLLNSGTVRDLFDTLERYYSIYHTGGIFFKVSNQKETVSIQYGFDQPTTVESRHITDWGLGFVAYYLKTPLADLSKPLIAQFNHSKPVDLTKLQSIFGYNLEFNQDQSKLIYRNVILNKQLREVDQSLLKILRQQADLSLRAFLKEESLAQKIRMLLIERISGDQANASDIAQELNYTLSSFKRKLVEENINFRKTKESIKNERAKKLLSKTRVCLSDIAKETGFSDQSSFTRFFIRCNKTTPQDFRKRYISKRV